MSRRSNDRTFRSPFSFPNFDAHAIPDYHAGAHYECKANRRAGTNPHAGANRHADVSTNPCADGLTSSNEPAHSESDGNADLYRG